MKRFILILTSLALFSCQNTNPTNIQPTVSPTPTPSISASPILSVKYTREDYIRLFECGMAAKLKNKDLDNYGTLAGHLSLIKNDMLWEVHNKEGSGQLATYNNDVALYILPYDCK